MAAKQNTSPLAWTFLLLMLGAFVAFVLYLDRQIGNRTESQPSLPTTAATETKPVIDFYQVLKDRKIDIPMSEEDQAAIDNPTLNKETSGKAILQVGSFQSAADAESMKAKLAFLGLEAQVESAQLTNGTWHRVQLGPFDSESRLSQARNRLIENEIDYMQRSMP